MKKYPGYTWTQLIIILIVIGFIILALVSLAIIWFSRPFSISIVSPSLTPSISSTSPSLNTQWQTYTNEKYKFRIQYPGDWELSETKSASAKGIVYFGHPLNGKLTYVMYVLALPNPEKLSSKAFVEKMLAQIQAEYNEGVRPSTVKYESAKELTLADSDAYELEDVFAYDQNEEEIYLAKGENVFQFTFPVAEENSNFSEPIANNQIIHQMLNTLEFIE
jgi:hypothetical protein